MAAPTTDTFEFKLGKTGQFIVTYLDYQGVREFLDLKPKSYFQFGVHSSMMGREYLVGKSDSQEFSHSNRSTDYPNSIKRLEFTRLLKASIRWAMINSDIDFSKYAQDIPFAFLSSETRFFGFDRDNHHILYVDLTKVTSAKWGVLHFTDGSSITPYRPFYDFIQETLRSSENLEEF